MAMPWSLSTPVNASEVNWDPWSVWKIAFALLLALLVAGGLEYYGILDTGIF
jgi:hypothetical protein